MSENTETSSIFITITGILILLGFFLNPISNDLTEREAAVILLQSQILVLQSTETYRKIDPHSGIYLGDYTKEEAIKKYEECENKSCVFTYFLKDKMTFDQIDAIYKLHGMSFMETYKEKFLSFF